MKMRKGTHPLRASLDATPQCTPTSPCLTSPIKVVRTRVRWLCQPPSLEGTHDVALGVAQDGQATMTVTPRIHQGGHEGDCGGGGPTYIMMMRSVVPLVLRLMGGIRGRALEVLPQCDRARRPPWVFL